MIEMSYDPAYGLSAHRTERGKTFNILNLKHSRLAAMDLFISFEKAGAQRNNLLNRCTVR